MWYNVSKNPEICSFEMDLFRLRIDLCKNNKDYSDKLEIESEDWKKYNWQDGWK